jgi:hypothetical protein
MTRAELGELIYPVPTWDTLEQHERFEHRDLARLSRPELLRERDQLEMRLTIDDRPPAWILERLGRVREALR